MLRHVSAVLCIVVLPTLAHGQVLLRWDDGDSALVAPDGVRLQRLQWSDANPDDGGLAFQLALDGGVAALGLDPEANLATLAPGWGGGAWNNRDAVFDGDATSAWQEPGYTCAAVLNGCDDIYAGPGTNEIDLGARFFIERIVVHSGLEDGGRTVRDFRVHLSDRLPALLWCCGAFRPIVAEVRDNRDRVRELTLASQERARFLQVAVGEREDGWELNDIEIFGRGFVEDAAWVSNVLPLDRSMAWGNLRWSGSSGDASVLIRTRTGTDADPQLYWRFTGLADQKQEVTRAQYGRLGIGERAGTSYDRAHWSQWSAPYDFADSAGTPVISPGPRSYVQARIDFIPTADAGGQVNWLELQASVPAATELIGEVWPVEAEIGTWERYTYYVFSSIAEDDTGFDRLEIRSLSQLGEVAAVRIGDKPAVFDVVEAEPHRFVLSLPHMRPEDSGAIVEVDFEARVLRYGSSFDGSVWSSTSALVAAQNIDPGDATGAHEGDRATVTTPVRSRQLLQVRITPEILTPNGDGINDLLTLSYEILDITGPAAVRIEILDLAGHAVRHLQDAQQSIGIYTADWDGRDDTGRTLPPGIYVGRVSLHTDGRAETSVDVLHVAY